MCRVMSTSRVGTASFFELAAMMTMKRVHFARTFSNMVFLDGLRSQSLRGHIIAISPTL